MRSQARYILARRGAPDLAIYHLNLLARRLRFMADDRRLQLCWAAYNREAAPTGWAVKVVAVPVHGRPQTLGWVFRENAGDLRERLCAALAQDEVDDAAQANALRAA